MEVLIVAASSHGVPFDTNTLALAKRSKICVLNLRHTTPAQVVKLVDTLASGASGLTAVAVQVRLWAPFVISLI